MKGIAGKLGWGVRLADRFCPFLPDFEIAAAREIGWGRGRYP